MTYTIFLSFFFSFFATAELQYLLFFICKMFAASPARIYHHHIYDDSKDGILYGDGDASSSLMYTHFADFSFAKFRLLADIAINSLKVPTLLYNIG